MATYTRSERVTTTVRYHVPAAPPYGAHPDEIAMATLAATKECAEKGSVGAMLRFLPQDDEIVIEFDTKNEG